MTACSIADVSCPAQCRNCGRGKLRQRSSMGRTDIHCHNVLILHLHAAAPLLLLHSGGSGHQRRLASNCLSHCIAAYSPVPTSLQGPWQEQDCDAHTQGHSLLDFRHNVAMTVGRAQRSREPFPCPQRGWCHPLLLSVLPSHLLQSVWQGQDCGGREEEDRGRWWLGGGRASVRRASSHALLGDRGFKGDGLQTLLKKGVA